MPCPMCGSADVKIVLDKTRVVSYIPAVTYAEKMVCQNCGFEYEKPFEGEKPREGVIERCPLCGSVDLAVVDDETRIESYIPAPQYAKKNICRKCGFEFPKKQRGVTQGGEPLRGMVGGSAGVRAGAVGQGPLAGHGDRLEKLEKIMAVADELPVSRLAKALGLDEDACWERVWDWASKFGFRVRGEVLVFGAGKGEDFIADLEKEFSDWMRPSGKRESP
ncbi:MAG: hypothetical protein ACTSU5_10505 [Promethearchaeota archaeon]